MTDNRQNTDLESLKEMFQEIRTECFATKCRECRFLIRESPVTAHCFFELSPSYWEVDALGGGAGELK